MRRTLTVAAVALALAGCGHNPPLQTAAAAGLPHDAKAVADKVAARIGSTVISVTSNTDPTKPAVADSEAVISDNRVTVQDPNPGADNGAKVEVYASAEDAKARYDYLQAIGKASPIFADSYDVTQGDFVFRVSGHMPIDGVKQYREAWIAILS